MLLTLHGEAQVVQADIRGVDGSLLEVVARQGLGETKVSASDRARARTFHSGVVGKNVGKRQSSATAGQGTLVDENTDGFAHLVGPSFLFN